MPDGLSVNIEGIDKLYDRLDDATVAVREKASDEFALFASETANEAKQRAPVNYGILKNSIEYIEGNPGELNSAVEVHARYAAYVEFGTGTHVEVGSDPDGLPEYALQFKGTHAVPGMEPRPYLFPAFRRQKTIFLARLQKLLDSI